MTKNRTATNGTYTTTNAISPRLQEQAQARSQQKETSLPRAQAQSYFHEIFPAAFDGFGGGDHFPWDFSGIVLLEIFPGGVFFHDVTALC